MIASGGDRAHLRPAVVYIAILLICAGATKAAAPATTEAAAEAVNSTPLLNDTGTTANPVITTTTKEFAHFNCSQDCICNEVKNAHTHFLHAKCNNLNSLISGELLLNATLPLHSIDLSYAQLTRVSPYILDKFHDLTSVDLSHNELHEIGNLGRRIKKLNLRHNRITSNKLIKMPENVQVLNLQHNDITTIPLEFTQLLQLNTVELSHNPINCTCETLEVRNWLQERLVFMANPVICANPPEARNKPWLQVKQSDICELEQHRDSLIEENELMMQDQPVESSNDDDDGGEELGQAFMPIALPLLGKSIETMKTNNDDDDVEGSGDVGEMSMPLAVETTSSSSNTIASELDQEDNDEDGSGSSGDGMLIIPSLYGLMGMAKRPSVDIFGPGMGIYNGKSTEDDAAPVTEGASTESDLTAVITSDSDGGIPAVSTAGPNDTNDKDVVKHASVKRQNDDGNATYYLLGVILLIVVGLILFVGIKRCQHNRNQTPDPESPRQVEMCNMDKKNPGVPLHKNGMEHHPLIDEKVPKAEISKGLNSAKKPYDTNTENDNSTAQPLLNGNGMPANNGASNNNEIRDAPHEYYPITPRYPTPKSPRASKYAQYPQNENNNNNSNNNNNNNNNVGDQQLLASPKSGRYSPVYSPETGRVKIKLSETPKPKTPMLVNRSKSSAGEIVCSPVGMQSFGTPANTSSNGIIPPSAAS